MVPEIKNVGTSVPKINWCLLGTSNKNSHTTKSAWEAFTLTAYWQQIRLSLREFPPL